ncbi:hypothetical protein MTO96_015048 [Rhipicephalus appendiculatus]
MLALTVCILLLLSGFTAEIVSASGDGFRSGILQRGRRAGFNLKDMEEDGFRKVHVYRRPRKNPPYSDVAANLVNDGLTYVGGRTLLARLPKRKVISLGHKSHDEKGNCDQCCNAK